MKDFRGMKRQRSRNRKPSGNQNNPNRAYESNGPEGTKVRGNAQTIYEKYQQLARDANSSGDRVLAENHLQHAEHYFRMLRQMQPQRPVSEYLQRDPFSNAFDVDYDEETETEGAEAEAEAQGGDEQPGDDQPRYDSRDRNGGDRNNNNGGNRNRDGRDRDNREFRNNNNGNGQPRFDNRNNGERNNNGNGQPRFDNNNGGNRDEGDFDGGRRETRRERYERRRQQRLSDQEQNLSVVAQPAAPSFIASTEPLAPRPLAEPAPSEQPAVRERPPRAQRAPVEANGNDSDHLPAFIRKVTPIEAAPAPVAEEEVAKPKRGRPKRKAEDVGAAEEA